MKSLIYLTFTLLGFSCFAQEENKLQPYVLIVQPIVVQSDEGNHPASMALPEDLVDKAYKNAGVDFHFLEPVFYNNTKARDGLINLDEIVRESEKIGLLKGQNDIVNMFFVNTVDGIKGPLGRGMMGGNITFIALGDNSEMDAEELKYMQAFVITHEVGHNLSLKHAVNDPNVSDTLPNIQGDGEFKDRIDPKYSLNEYQINIVYNSPLVHSRIDFLSKEQGAKGILDESFEAYFSQLQLREIAAFVNEKVPTDDITKGRAFAKEKFASAVIDFTDKEKEIITFVNQRVIETLQKNNLSLMANHPWRFIKIEDWLCGGFAHTRGTFIILSQKHIDHLSKMWSDKMTPEEETELLKGFGGLLVHEQMHSLQRTYKSKFNELYTNYWNFVHANVPIEKSIQIDQVSNPDAPIAEWIIPNTNDKDSYFWVRTLLKKGSDIPVMGRDFTDKVFTVEQNEGNYRVLNDADGEPISHELSHIDFYRNSFPVTRGLDHPNEISAYMFSDYYKALLTNEKPFGNINSDAEKNVAQFIKWIQLEMNR